MYRYLCVNTNLITSQIWKFGGKKEIHKKQNILTVEHFYEGNVYGIKKLINLYLRWYVLRKYT